MQFFLFVGKIQIFLFIPICSLLHSSSETQNFVFIDIAMCMCEAWYYSFFL